MDTTKTNTVLVLEQHSDAERFSIQGWERKQGMHCMYDAPIHRMWSEMVDKFPECVKEVRENARASYGSSNWKKGEDGRIALISENWDSGD